MLIPLLLSTCAISALAFANAPIGSQIENISMPVLSGGEHSLVSETNVSLFVFIKPGMEHSHNTLVQLAACQKELAGKPVHWAVVVSDRIPQAQVEEEMKSIRMAAPVLVDKGDALYGRLGVVLLPVIGITDQHKKLLAYQPFAKVNYRAVVKARLLHALGEITDRELQEVIEPLPVEMGSEKSIAHRFLKLAEKQFAAGNGTQALTNISRSIEKSPTAGAYRLRGQILSAMGNRKDALASFEAALKLDPEDRVSQEAIKSLR